jgi:hypothetical protein
MYICKFFFINGPRARGLLIVINMTPVMPPPPAPTAPASHSKIEPLPNKTSIMPQPQSRVGGYIDSMFCREYHTSYHVALAPGRRTEKFGWWNSEFRFTSNDLSRRMFMTFNKTSWPTMTGPFRENKRAGAAGPKTRQYMYGTLWRSMG